MGHIKIKNHTVLYSDRHQKYIDEWNWHIHKTKTGNYVRGYPKGKRDGGLFYMHRVFTGAPKGMDVDHRNGDGLNNRDENLRVCTRNQNNANRHKVQSKTSKYKGVHYESQTGKWRAEVTMMGARYRLGRFESQEDAVKAYYKKAQELFKEYAMMAVK